MNGDQNSSRNDDCQAGCNDTPNDERDADRNPETEPEWKPIFRREDTPGQLDRNVEEELAFHLEWRRQKLIARGLSEEEAERVARERFGDAGEVGDELRRAGHRAVRTRRITEAIGDFGRDILSAGRRLGRAPGFTLAVVLSLALGIGLNVTIFSFVNAILLRPLPVSDPAALYSVHTANTGAVSSISHGHVSYPDFVDLREMNDVFTSLAAHAYSPVSMGDGEGADVVLSQMVSHDFFAILGVEPELGRTFLPEEDLTPGSHRVAILSWRAWQNSFDGDPDLIGETVALNARPYTIIGIMPEDFTGLSVLLQPLVWTPVMMVGEIFPYQVSFDGRVDPWVSLVGRLREGVTGEQAQAELDRIGTVLADAWPELNTHKRFLCLPAEETRINHIETTGGAARLSNLLLAMTVLVLGIACFNAANLHLADATRRQTELAVRHSLGASRGRIIRGLLIESILPALGAGVLGFLFALWAARGLWSLQSRIDLPLQLNLAPDTRVLGFTLLITLAAGLFFGLAPALTLLRRRAFDRLRVSTSSLARTRGTARVQKTLVAAQVAVAMLLVSVTGLFARSLHNTLAIDSGLGLENGLVLEVNLGLGEYNEERGRTCFRDLEEGLAALPGVSGVARATALPLGQSHGHHNVFIEGYEPGPDEYMVFKRNMISAGYLETLGIPVVAGRGIDERDTADSAPVAVVNETMARRYWPDGDPVGRTIWADQRVARTVVGVIANGKYSNLNDAPEPYLCIPLSQAPWVQRQYVVAAVHGDPRQAVAGVRELTASLDPGLPVPIMTLADHLSLSTGSQAFPVYMIGALTLLALLLTLIGIYGVSSCAVGQRIREFGLRTALGADQGNIIREVMGQGLRTAGVGLVVGAAASLVAGRILAASLFRVAAVEPVLLILLPVMTVIVTLLATVLPARQAARIDPIDALRVE